MVRHPAAETDERSSLFKISCRVLLSIQALKARGKFNILLLLMEVDKKLHAKIYHIFAVWKDPKVKASCLSLTSVDKDILVPIFRDTKAAHGVTKIRKKLKSCRVRLEHHSM